MMVLKKSAVKARFRPGLLAFVLLVGGAGLAGVSVPVHAQSDYETSNRLKRLENEVQTLSRAVYRGESPPPGSLDAAGGGADAEIRIQQLESEIRDLRGKLEEQSYQIRQLKEQIERFTSDMELRMNDLEGGRAGATPSAPYTAGGSSQGRDLGPGASASDGAGGDSYQWSTDGGEKPLGSYSQSPSGARGGADLAAATYENAFSLIKNRRYDAAAREFKVFLERYPNHVLAGNAKYWLGETYYVRGEFETASRIFAEGYQQYPKGAKAADNLLKLGMSLAAQGKNEDACIALSQLDKEDFIGSGPVMRRAEQERQRLGC